jgi:hypothetical protein
MPARNVPPAPGQHDDPDVRAGVQVVENGGHGLLHRVPQRAG